MRRVGLEIGNEEDQLNPQAALRGEACRHDPDSFARFIAVDFPMRLFK